MIRVWIAKLMIANRELRGLRATLFRLVSAATALFLSVMGIIFVLIGWNEFGLVVILINTGLLSIAVSISAFKALKVMLPLLQRMK